MIQLIDEGRYLVNGNTLFSEREYAEICGAEGILPVSKEEAKKGTISYGILESHNVGTEEDLRLKFDALTSHDMTNVNIIQTARACGLKEFPIPVVLTNCQNTLCAVGGTINRDDHLFALSAARKYGGINVPINISVIHTYMREMMAVCGNMIMGADSHTRYGALGTLSVGEGGGELVKQMMSQTYDMPRPSIVGVYMKGRLRPGIGPHDVALAIIGATYKNNFVKNCVMEFFGEGIAALSQDYRNSIDCMTTETACWSSVWQTDETVFTYMANHGRPEAYKELKPADVVWYDRILVVDLSEIHAMIALPFHPSNTYTIKELLENPVDILHKVELDAIELTGNKNLELNLHSKYYDGKLHVDQGIIGGCSGGTYENICAAADILAGANIGDGIFNLSVYPDSQPTYLELIRNGSIPRLMQTGTICREAICGPCTGCGETPGNGEFSIRHNTRNFIYREGAKPGDGQHAWVALMDARSIAATAANGGCLTAAEDFDVIYGEYPYHFEKSIYDKKVYNGIGNPKPETELLEGPNIKTWPEMPALPESLLIKVCSYINDPVTTTDELIPSGDTSSYRSNPIMMADFTLCRRDSSYVPTAKAVASIDLARRNGEKVWESEELASIYRKIMELPEMRDAEPESIGIGSSIYAKRPGDGSAREQAASCQRILGGSANLADEYATKRYRSNLINWGIVPFVTAEKDKFANGDYIVFPGLRKAVEEKTEIITGYVLKDEPQELKVTIGTLSDIEREILLEGCMINFTRSKTAEK